MPIVQNRIRDAKEFSNCALCVRLIQKKDINYRILQGSNINIALVIGIE